MSDDYAFQVGAAGRERLALIERGCGPGTEHALSRAGLGPGMRAIDVGCGTGAVVAWMAERVGESGAVTGVDGSASQLAIARDRVPPRVELVQADVRATGLARGAFDVVFCRFVLMHLADPDAALRELVALARPGGVVVCVEPDFTTRLAEPPSPALDRSYELMRALGARRGQDWTIGRRLPVLLVQHGIAAPQVAITSPAALTGPLKRLAALNLVEAREALVDAGLATAAELDRTVTELEAVADDPNQLVAFAANVHAWGATPQR